jgi:hypothetical protein
MWARISRKNATTNLCTTISVTGGAPNARAHKTSPTREPTTLDQLSSSLAPTKFEQRLPHGIGVAHTAVVHEGHVSDSPAEERTRHAVSRRRGVK